jgi:endonuclease YncB( thermonuclease family)
MHDRPARFIDNHDGDTVTMLLDQGFNDRKIITLRLANVWAPELNEEGGQQAKAYLRFLVTGPNSVEEWPFIVHTQQTKTGKDIMSFSRYVATVMMSDGESLNSKLMKYLADTNQTGGMGSIVRPKEEVKEEPKTP